MPRYFESLTSERGFLLGIASVRIAFVVIYLCLLQGDVFQTCLRNYATIGSGAPFNGEMMYNHTLAFRTRAPSLSPHFSLAPSPLPPSKTPLMPPLMPPSPLPSYSSALIGCESMAGTEQSYMECLGAVHRYAMWVYGGFAPLYILSALLEIFTATCGSRLVGLSPRIFILGLFVVLVFLNCTVAIFGSLCMIEVVFSCTRREAVVGTAVANMIGFFVFLIFSCFLCGNSSYTSVFSSDESDNDARGREEEMRPGDNRRDAGVATVPPTTRTALNRSSKQKRLWRHPAFYDRAEVFNYRKPLPRTPPPLQKPPPLQPPHPLSQLSEGKIEGNENEQLDERHRLQRGAMLENGEMVPSVDRNRFMEISRSAPIFNDSHLSDDGGGGSGELDGRGSNRLIRGSQRGESKARDSEATNQIRNTMSGEGDAERGIIEEPMYRSVVSFSQTRPVTHASSNIRGPQHVSSETEMQVSQTTKEEEEEGEAEKATAKDEEKENEDEEEEDPCCEICLCSYRRFDVVRTLRCGHRYHRKCVDQFLLKKQGICPTCRLEVTNSSN